MEDKEIGQERDTTRSWLDLSDAERQAYIRMVCKCTKAIMAKDCRFSLILYGADGGVAHGTTINTQSLPALLLHLAKEIEDENVARSRMN